MKKNLLRKITLLTLGCFFSMLLADAYPLSAAADDDALALIEKGEADYSNGLFPQALAAFNQAMNLAQKNEHRERLLLGLALVHFALGDKEKSGQTLSTLLQMSPARQLDMRIFPEAFIQLYGQVNWQVQEIKSEQKRLAASQAKPGPGSVEKTGKTAALKKKKKFPWLLAILGVGVVVGAILLLTKKKKPAINYTLTVTKGAGVSGTPEAGTYTYVQGDIVNYSYTPQAGYTTVEVKLNNSVVAASGAITMDQDYTLAATGRSENYDYDTRVLGLEWIQVPAGEFKMGDNFGVGEARERPVHTVNLDAYAIGKYEVTFAQYDKFCEETGRGKPIDRNWGRGAMPVINVSWNDADAFCQWLAAKTGKKIHLITEAQWERAAAGTDQRQYPWGNAAPNCGLANYRSCGLARPKPVGSYPAGASAVGAMDMAGNVWEWVLDWTSDTYYQECLTQGTVKNPQGPASGSDRVLRSGSYAVAEERLRCAFRDFVQPGYSSNVIGFRIAWDQ